ncbi:GumC family protein [Mucilaginibacter sp.]|jgi:capsular exopolysaccharide synthesis family protein|uniref:GumC family protein n=1 Tax=Mucilaginibacter sp. TaxID=1882438 RepID=UPI00356B56C2
MKTNPVKESNNGLRYFLLQTKTNWYLFVISLVLFLGLAYAYNTFATKQYLIYSTMLLQQHPNTPEASSQFSNGGVSSVLNVADNIKNEGDILRSRNLMKEVVQSMHLNLQYFTNSGLLAKEIYHEAPFYVQLVKSKVDSLKWRDYKINIVNDTTVKITSEDEGVDRTVSFGKSINLPQYEIKIIRRNGISFTSSEYSVRIFSEDDAINILLAGYDASFTDKATTNVMFTLYYPHPKKGEDILQSIMNRYLMDNIADKRKNIDSTIDFINKRIAVVATELNEIEKNYQDFRSSNDITDINEQSKVLVGNASEYANRYQQQQIQLSIINDLKNRLNDSSNKDVIPSSINIQNTSFAAGLAQYNNLLNEKEKRKLSYTEDNPVVQNLNQQIQVVRHNLLQSIDSYKKEMELSSAGLSSQNNAISGSIKKVPGKQRAMIDYARQQELKQQLYVYLLQKREETAMAKAADMPYSRIIDNAKSTKDPVKPIKQIIYVMSFFLGLIVPFGYVNSKHLFGSKISSEADIEKQTDVTIIGKIGHNSLSEKYLVDITSRSPVTESFRTLRTKLRNILDPDQSNVIMITSSVKGEGKTFMTCNLASTLAMSGKRVVMIEMDLRKPKLSGLLDIDYADRGFSNYVLDGLDINSIIKPTAFSHNCFIISSGPVVANASELLLTDKLGELIADLRKRFDYVLIDSSPVGLVSDALVIQKYVDMTIYVCRHNYTDKAQIDIINNIQINDKVDNLYLVINDVDFSKTGYTGYGYGMGYGN